MVAQTRIIREWNIPSRSERDYVLLDLAADILGGGKTSRLYQRLVYRDKLVDSVQAGASPFELASQFEVQADVKQGVDPAKVEAAIAVAKGPTVQAHCLTCTGYSVPAQSAGRTELPALLKALLAD